MRRIARRHCICRRRSSSVVWASPLPQSAAQLTVFDPANYQQNLLVGPASLEQINNQVRQLQNQAQMLPAHGSDTC